MINGFKHILKKAVQIPKSGLDMFFNYQETKRYAKKTVVSWKKLTFNFDRLKDIETQLKFQKPSPTVLMQDDRNLLVEIKKKTLKLNQNNLSRTKAYLDFYLKHPEVHWAFLAHLVSRNGGWNMTDLKGSILAIILSTEARNDFFSFLERANALIFNDAFPQLLLYEASKNRNKNLFFLLPKLAVSQFMRPFWDNFFTKKDSHLLTVALIINEQNYIEKKVIQNPFYNEKVLNNILFKLQEVLQFTYVLFPYQLNRNKTRLTGETVTDFEDLSHRIEIGKNLYSILFGNETLYEDVYQFATNQPHTGSRNDYWPKMFTKNASERLATPSFTCAPKQPTVYSPTLEAAWTNVGHSFTDHEDWFSRDSKFLKFFSTVTTPTTFDLSSNYCQDLHKMIIASVVMETAQG